MPLSRILVILLILQFYLCFAASPNLFGQYRFDTWTTDNGLPQNGVRAVTQTPDGYLWFTTFDGLVRFDGVRFTTFNKSNTKGILNNRFTWIYSDRDGTIYAATTEDGTLTIYRHGTFSTMTSDQVPGHYIQKILPDANGEPRFLAEDESRTSKTWYYLRDGKFVFDETNGKNNERYEVEGKAGTRWIITPRETIEERGGTAIVYPLDLSRVVFRVNAFADAEGGLWIGENQVHRLQNGVIETFDERQGFPQNSIYHSFWQDADASVWFASGGGMSSSVGLAQYKNGEFKFWGREQGLALTTIFNLFHDREGAVWLATNKGLSRLRREIIRAYGVKDGIGNPEVYPLYRDRDSNIWIGTNKGLSIYRDGNFETLELKPARAGAPADEIWRSERMSVQSLWQDANGKMWVGLNGGIYIVENGTAEMLKNTNAHIFAIREDSADNVWAATNKGLWRFRDYKLAASYSVEDGLPNEFMTFVFEDSKQRLWFGGLGGLTELRDGKFVNYTAQNGLAGNYVRTIYEDDEGTFWIGTYDEGMSRFKDGRFVSIKESDGLYNSGVFAIEEDARGNFWISSNRGIYRVRRRELNDFADGKIAKITSVGYGKQDGMLSIECNGGRQPASLRDGDGKFWFPTQEGVVVVDPQAEKPNLPPPPVVIETVTVEREPVNFASGAAVEPGQQNIEINYTGISLIKSEQTKFKYKLEGHDADWIDAGTRRAAYYSYLPPGNYTFRVIAANSEGIWNETGASVNLELKPFFYQTRAFYLLILAIGVLILFVVWKTSVYQLEARQRKLTKLVAEKTEELHHANIELEHLANSDGLTKIGNRRRFEKFLADEWHRAVRFKTEISLVLLDIDHFKLFNDTYGHQAGDECLQKVAEALAEAIHRPTDLVARFGGEEFAIVLGGTDNEGALNIARQAIENVKNLGIAHAASTTSEFLTVSVGIATVLAKFDMTETELIKAADAALYQAKNNGRNQIALKNLTWDFEEISLLEKELLGVR